MNTNFETMTAAQHRDRTVRAWTEKQFQQQVIGLARAIGWTEYHTYDSRRSQPGWPDLVLIHPEHGVLFRELKTEKGRVTPAQRAWLDLLTGAGQDSAVWRPSDYLSGRIKAELNPSPGSMAETLGSHGGVVTTGRGDRLHALDQSR